MILKKKLGQSSVEMMLLIAVIIIPVVVVTTTQLRGYMQKYRDKLTENFQCQVRYGAGNNAVRLDDRNALGNKDVPALIYVPLNGSNRHPYSRIAAGW